MVHDFLYVLPPPKKKPSLFPSFLPSFFAMLLSKTADHLSFQIPTVGTSHPSVTDAPLIEPWLLSVTTGSTISVHEGVNQYVKVSESFLRYQQTGLKQGILSECVTHPEYYVEDDNMSDSGQLRETFQKYWQIHVAPCGSEDEGEM